MPWMEGIHFLHPLIQHQLHRFRSLLTFRKVNLLSGNNYISSAASAKWACLKAPLFFCIPKWKHCLRRKSQPRDGWKNGNRLPRFGSRHRPLSRAEFETIRSRLRLLVEIYDNRCHYYLLKANNQTFNGRASSNGPGIAPVLVSGCLHSSLRPVGTIFAPCNDRRRKKFVLTLLAEQQIYQSWREIGYSDGRTSKDK